jgi:hypothetical protein
VDAQKRIKRVVSTLIASSAAALAVAVLLAFLSRNAYAKHTIYVDADHIISEMGGGDQLFNFIQEIRDTSIDGMTQIVLAAPVCDTDMTAWTEHIANPVFGQGVDGGPKAYYPSVLHSPTAFDGHGERAYYKMWFGTSGGKTGYAISEDGLNWITVTVPLTEISGYHAHVLYDADQFGENGNAPYYKMWYWDVNNSINYATSQDGIEWENYAGNPVITNALGLGSAPVYDANVIYNSDGMPANYEAWIDNNGKLYYITSTDGITWTGDNEALLTDRADWEASTYSRVSVLKQGGVYHMWYGGSSAGGGNHGIGYAVSSDGQHWVKSVHNPILHKDDGSAWRNSRTYTPRVLYSASRFDGHGSPEHYKMWFTGKDAADGNYAIGYATLNPVSLSIADMSGSGQNSTVGSALSQPFVVGLRDACDEPVSDVIVTLAISGTPAGAAGQSLSVLTGTTNASGQVFTTLTLGDKPGVYTVTADSMGVLGMPTTFTATASLLCTCQGDAYEGDDVPVQVTPLQVGYAYRQTRDFCDDAADWITFTARVNNVYTITTSSWGQRADTLLALFDTDGRTLLAANDDYEGTADYSSRIVWQAPADGVYYVRTTNQTRLTGCNTNYAVWIERQEVSSIYLPIVARNYSTVAVAKPDAVFYPMGVISHTCPDDYESDDTWQQARAVETGIVQAHSFDSNPEHYVADKDVVWFDASIGRTITFTVASITNTQTLLELYNEHGAALDVTGTTRLVWTPTTDGRHYLSVSSLTTTFGCADTVGYNLLAETSPLSIIYLPLVIKD